MKTPSNVYRRFIEFEERAAKVYLHLASRFREESQLSSFWLDMAMEEKQHAGLLQFCLGEGMFVAEVPDRSEIQKLLGLFKRLEKLASDPKLTVDKAFLLAIEMEISEINAIYCHLTTPTHTSMYLLRKKIATSLPNHVNELLKAADKFGIRHRMTKELHRLEKHCTPRWKAIKSSSRRPLAGTA